MSHGAERELREIHRICARRGWEARLEAYDAHLVFTLTRGPAGLAGYAIARHRTLDPAAVVREMLVSLQFFGYGYFDLRPALLDSPPLT